MIRAQINQENRLLTLGANISTIILIMALVTFFYVPMSGGTVDVIVLEDFSGVEEIFYEGFGDSTQTVITDSEWALDSITVDGADGSRSLLDQTIVADEDHTQINRVAMYMGPGFVGTDSIYMGSKTGIGEDNRTGITISGTKYGVLIQNGTLEFDELFGGIEKSIAVASGNYMLEQFGYTGEYTSDSFIEGDNSAFFSISGGNSATLISLVFGSTPQPGMDAFDVETIGWAKGNGAYVFSGSSGDSSTSGFFEFGQGNISLDAVFESIKINNSFEVDI